MKREALSESLICSPICATFCRRSETVFVASPFNAFPTSSCIKEAVPSVSYQGPVDCLRLSRDERNLALTTQSLIKFFDLNTGREKRQLPAHSLPIRVLCPKRTSIYDWISGSLDGSWAAWDLRCHPAKVLDGRASGPIRCVDISPDDSMLAIGTDTSLQLCDIRNRQILQRFSVSTTGLVFCPTERLLASYGSERVVRFWCLDQMACVGVSDSFTTDIRGCGFSGMIPEHDFVVVSSDSEIRVLTWDPCDTLVTSSFSTICEKQEVLELTMTEDDICFITHDCKANVSLLTIPVEEVLSGNLAFNTTSDSDESIPEEPREQPSPSPSPSTSSSSSSSTNMRKDPEETRGRPPAPPNGRPLRNRTASASNNRTAVETASNSVQAKDAMKTRTRSPSESAASRATPKTRSPSESKPPTAPIKSRKPSPVTMNRANIAEQSGKTQDAESDDDEFDAILSKFDVEHVKFMSSCQKFTSGVKEVAKAVRSGNATTLLREMTFAEVSVAAASVDHINKAKTWDLFTASVLLPRLRDLLEDSSKSVRATSIVALDQIAVGLVERICICLRGSAFGIGVDVAAEERREMAENCKKELLVIREDRDRIYKKLPLEESASLDEVIRHLKRL